MEQEKLEEEHKVQIEKVNIQTLIRNKSYLEAALLSFKQNFVKNFLGSMELYLNSKAFETNFIYYNDFFESQKENLK